MVGEDTHSWEEIISYSVKIKVVPYINTANDDVLHFFKDCFFNFLIGISWTNNFLGFEHVKYAIAVGLYLGSFTEVFKLILYIFFHINAIICKPKTSTQNWFESINNHNYVVFLINDKLALS